MNKVKVGEKYGLLLVIENHHPKDEVVCVCECGNKKIARATNLYYGGTKSCGCLAKKNHSTKHKGTGTRLYGIWKGMRERCNTRSSTTYKRYGGKGITVCSEWNDFDVFREWALSHGYADDLTIDRINSAGNYEPNNCRWATYKEQANNLRTNRVISFNGRTMTMTQWGDELGIKPTTIWARLKRGWSIEQTLTTEVGRK